MENKKLLLFLQKAEITGNKIYQKLSSLEKNEKNRSVLAAIAEDEAQHYQTFRTLTEEDVKPDQLYVFLIVLAARILGITFAVRYMERQEDQAQKAYFDLLEQYPQLKQTLEDEEKHESLLIEMIEEERLEYVGSMVLGLNDALVELTGTLAGLSFAFQDTKFIAISGLITGIAASLSMASSEYLSNRAEEKSGRAVSAALYTGIAYIFTVIVLVLPYFLFQNYLIALSVMLTVVILVILAFNFYLSVAKNLPFRKHFFEMAAISLGVALLSFGVGILVRQVFGIEI